MGNSGRKPWVAGVLSGFAPGLGHLYCGQWKKGLTLHLLFILVGAVVSYAILFYVSYPPFNVIAPLGLIAGGSIFIFLDAVLTARKLRNDFQLKPVNKWFIYVGIIVLVSFGEPELVRLLMKAFNIPHGSMIPTLLLGDHILVDKIEYAFADPRRKDVIIFPYPEDESKTFVKRIIGLPGETITIRNKVVSINDENLNDDEYTQRLDPGMIDGQISHRDNFGPITVPDNSYFVLGDNRDQSLDSRFWGFVERDKILGKVAIVYWSWDPIDWQARWARIGQHIH